MYACVIHKMTVRISQPRQQNIPWVVLSGNYEYIAPSNNIWGGTNSICDQLLSTTKEWFETACIHASISWTQLFHALHACHSGSSICKNTSTNRFL